MHSASRRMRLNVLAVGLALAAQTVAAQVGMQRPDGWTELPKEKRPWVWVLDLEYQPEPRPQAPFQGLRIALLPVHNSNSPDSHLAVPPEKFKREKVLTRLDGEQRERVLGMQVMTHPWKGKVSSAILTPEPFENLLFEALSRELAALGAEVVPSPIEAPPITTESFVQLVADLPREGPVDYYIAVKIEDFYSEQFYRGFRPHPFLAGQLELIPWVSVSFELSLRLADARAGKLRWEGRSQLTQTAKGGSLTFLLEWWENVILSSFPSFIRKAIGDNEDLRYALEPPTFRIRMPQRARRPALEAKASAAPVAETPVESETQASASDVARSRVGVEPPPGDPPENEPPPMD